MGLGGALEPLPPVRGDSAGCLGGMGSKLTGCGGRPVCLSRLSGPSRGIQKDEDMDH